MNTICFYITYSILFDISLVLTLSTTNYIIITGVSGVFFLLFLQGICC